MARRDPAVGLGPTQVLVLRLLASGSKSASYLAYDHPALTESSARSAVMRLAGRGLADVAGWDDYERRTYCLTTKGAEVERNLNAADDEEAGPMRKFKGHWTARVDQEFEIEAETEAEARELLDEEMRPRNVVELLDFEVVEFEEAG